jgi:hypothetical protein
VRLPPPAPDLASLETTTSTDAPIKADPTANTAQKAYVPLHRTSAPENEAEADVDIIAIHGLDTKSPDTWNWKPKDGNSTEVSEVN